MSYVLPEPVTLKFWGGERTILKRDAMLIRLSTDSGLRGYAPGPAHMSAVDTIRNVIKPHLIGKNPLYFEQIQFSGTLQEEKIYGAVEIALMDLASRYEECPLSSRIGEPKRNNIQLYGSAGMYMSPSGFGEEAAAIADMGFPAYKMRTALGPEKDLETLESMRKSTSRDFGLMVDAHTWWRMGDKSYSEATILDLARSMSTWNPYWLEEPLPPENHDAYRSLRSSRVVPVATGEHEQEESGFMDLIETQATDYVQMDVCCQGGVSMANRIFDAVEKAGLKFAFHSWGTNLEVLAAAHLGICRPESVVEWLEYPCYANQGRPGMYPFPLADEILKAPLDIRNGRLEVPKEPGLGIEIDESVIDRYPFQPGPWSFFKLDSPPETIAVTGDHSIKWVDPDKDT